MFVLYILQAGGGSSESFTIIRKFKDACPADTRKKVRAGSRIVKINGKSICSSSRHDVEKLLAAKGSAVTLVVCEEHMLNNNNNSAQTRSSNSFQRSLSNGLESRHSDSFVAVEQLEMPLWSRTPSTSAASRGSVATTSLDSFSSLTSPRSDDDEELSEAALLAPWSIRWHDAIETVSLAKEANRKKIGLTYKFKSKVSLSLHS